MQEAFKILANFSTVTSVVSVVAFFVGAVFLYLLYQNKTQLSKIAKLVETIKTGDQAKIARDITQSFPMDKELTKQQNFEIIKMILHSKEQVHKRTIQLAVFIISICCLLIAGLIISDLYKTKPQTEIPSNNNKQNIATLENDTTIVAGNIPKHVIEELKTYDIDAFSILGSKSKPTPNIEIYSNSQKYIITGKDLLQEHSVEGINVSDNLVRSLYFIGAGVSATSVDDMNIKASDLDTHKTLGIEVNDKDDNIAKRIEVFFDKPLKKGDRFNVKVSFLLKNTMYLTGKDYVLASTSYLEKVHKFKVTLKFENGFPNGVKVHNLNNDNLSTNIPKSKDGGYDYELTDVQGNFLNKMWLILTYDRQ